MTIRTKPDAAEPRLTPRDLQVLALIADGLPNPEIAAELNITVETVKSHIRLIHRTLGARSRAHAVHLGHRHGLLVQAAIGATEGVGGRR
jgi:DNA-binding CsgD family transcriptional regulator